MEQGRKGRGDDLEGWKGDSSNIVGLHKCVSDKGTNQLASHPEKLSFYYNEDADTYQTPGISPILL